MSSPLAKPEKNSADQMLIALHQRASHGTRVRILAKALASKISMLFPHGSVKALDVGCGDMSLADAISVDAPDVTWTCVDIHPCAEEKRIEDSRWNRYMQFDGKTLPFGAKQFDVVTFSDVLHHVPEELRIGLLRSAATVGSQVLIKDHFEYGAFSRLALRAMDFVGNFGYGVSVPQRYFSRSSFERLCDAADLKIVSCDVGLSLYDHLPVVRQLLSPKWQFIALCELKG